MKRPEFKTWVLRRHAPKPKGKGNPEGTRSLTRSEAHSRDQTWTVEGAGPKGAGTQRGVTSTKSNRSFKSKVFPLLEARLLID